MAANPQGVGVSVAALLCKHLAATAAVAPADLSDAQQIASESAQHLGPLLLKLGMLSEETLVEAYAAVLGLSIAVDEDYPAEPVEHPALREDFLRDSQIVPLRVDERTLGVATGDPENDYALAGLRMATGRALAIKLATPSQIQRIQERLYGGGQSEMGGLVDRLETASLEDSNDVERLRDLAIDAPIVNLVNHLLEKAIETRASDIHIEPFETRLRIRYRVDGMLRDVEAPPLRSAPAILSRVKLMASMNIAERRLPQDGRIQFRHHGTMIDLRVSAVPTAFGESVVLRILDRDNVQLDVRTLGFSQTIVSRIEELLALPNGIILVTGPTGSGKTTTLYAALRELNTSVRKILTVEDPVEYILDGVNQIPTRPQIGLGFPEVLRSIVRQDPDVIMVGEMRDLETARIAVQSALTGHLVLSTLHTNDAGSSITRLVDMGVEPFLVTSTVTAIVAQRLVRRLCRECRRPASSTAALADTLHAHGLDPATGSVHAPVGCAACGGTGFSGRLVIGELLCMSDELRKAIIAKADGHVLEKLALAAGMERMAVDGLRKVTAGITTLEEVSRVTRF
jgi:general secretion pathway protein E